MKIGNAFPLTNRNEETDVDWRDINWSRVRKHAPALKIVLQRLKNITISRKLINCVGFGTQVS